MKKYNIFAFATFIGVFALAAQGLCALEGAFTGMGAEVNANTREGVAFGGALSMGLDLNRHWGIGLKTAFSHNAGTVSALEPSALLRLYIPIKNSSLFFQADTGAAIFFEDGSGYPAFMGGLTAGWRFRLGPYWYAEPSFRGGYPFAWGAGLGFGVYFNADLFSSVKR